MTNTPEATPAELKPCAHCGWDELWEFVDEQNYLRIQCEKCGVMVCQSAAPDAHTLAAQRWNTRTSDAAAEARAEARGREAERKACAEIADSFAGSKTRTEIEALDIGERSKGWMLAGARMKEQIEARTEETSRD